MRMSRLISLIAGLTLILIGVGTAFVWTVCRAYVPPNKMLVLTRKVGQPMPPGQIIAEDGQKGIQREALGPGRYFFNPYVWDWELVDLVEIPAGDPQTWGEVWTTGAAPETPKLKGDWPKVGVVTSLAGKPWDGSSEVVEPGYQGIQRQVLTPGVYRINPRAYKVELRDAVVVPVGCVGVVTSQLGEMPGVETARETSIGPDGQPVEGLPKVIQKLAEQGQRGVERNVLQPGLYYLNPYVHKVTVVQCGYSQITLLNTSNLTENITFPSRDGFIIGVEITVVWGRHPEHTAEMVNRFGDVQKIEQLILGQIRSICRNQGSEYESTDFIRGEKRELYQQEVTATLQRVAKERDIEILIALIHNIEVRPTGVAAEGMDLRETIQRGYIAQEQDLTKQALRETARVQADLETAKANVEIARETIRGQTRKKVAEVKALGDKKAREIEAQRDLEVARIERQIAEIESRKIVVLGKAEADVSELTNQAEATGQRMLIEAFGSGAAYNLHTFAENFQPESVRLLFAGEGTLWTDLNKLQDAATLELLKPPASPK